MRMPFESDTGFYYTVGVFVIAVFTVGVAALVIVDPTGVDGRTLIPLTVGFFLFMFVYFISISIQRIEAGEDI